MAGLEDIERSQLAASPDRTMVEWMTGGGHADYAAAVAFMEARARDIACGQAGEAVWLTQHAPALHGRNQR